MDEHDAVIAECVAELERMGLSSVHAAWVIVVGGLNALSDASDDAELSEMIDSVAQQVNVGTDALH